MKRFDLEYDILTNPGVRSKIQQSPTLAKALYAALCNNEFRHTQMTADDLMWCCTWRYAGELVARVVDTNQDYLDYYCSGNEGYISPEVETLLGELGWQENPVSESEMI